MNANSGNNLSSLLSEEGEEEEHAQFSGKKQRILDITADWKLGKKDLDEGTLHRLVDMLGSMVMAMSVQLKVVKSICMFCSMIHATSECAMLSQKRTTANKATQANQRTNFPPFTGCRGNLGDAGKTDCG